MNKREVWVDNVKVMACILVVLGHFFQSMIKSGIIPNNDIYKWLDQSIYYFHVPLFFICSGYLYEKLCSINNIKEYLHNILKKFLNLGIPYFTFSLITLALKKIFQNSINSAESDNIINTLFLNPVAPYWYLYALFFIFLITVTAKDKRTMNYLIIMALCIKLVSIVWINNILPYAVNIVFINEIWFVIGMAIFKFDLNKKIGFKSICLGIIFIPLTMVTYKFNIINGYVNFIMGLLGCLLTISIMLYIFRDNVQNKFFSFAAKYTMPVFLMHTIFASGIRSILTKAGISNSILQIIFGIVISFIGPIIAAIIMERSKCLNIFLYPSKLIRI